MPEIAVILDEKAFRSTLREEFERLHRKRPDRQGDGDAPLLNTDKR